MSSLDPDRLREMREKRGLTQRELARLCSMGENQINKYENGGGEPSISNLKLIAQELGVTTDYLLGLSDSPNERTDVSLRPDERQLLEAYTAGDGLKMFALMYERLQKLMKLPTSSDETTPE